MIDMMLWDMLESEQAKMNDQFYFYPKQEPQGVEYLGVLFCG